MHAYYITHTILWLSLQLYSVAAALVSDASVSIMAYFLDHLSIQKWGLHLFNSRDLIAVSTTLCAEH